MSDVESLQAAYCAETDREYRRSHGQFFTPRWIARGMARWVTEPRPRRIVDPAFGLGILSDECLHQGFDGKIVGYEIDPSVVERWRTVNADGAGIELRHADFLDSANEPIEAAIVNPPYNRFQRRDLSPALQLTLARSIGAVASGYTNQYALFLYLVLSRLVEGGRAAFIVPSEFLATGYGVQVKQFLLRDRRLRHLVLFDPATRVFAEASTTACVLLFDGRACDKVSVWHLPGDVDESLFARLCSSQADGREAQHADVSCADLDARENWQALGLGGSDMSGFTRLDAFGSVKRGIATGANEFFVLRPSEALQWRFGASDLVPCIASASAVTRRAFTDSDLSVLEARDKPSFLFDGLTSPSSAAAAYLEHGVACSYDQRYLTRMRRPWYRLEARTAAPLLVAVFGRGGFRVCRNLTSAVNLTAFHGFYPKSGCEALVDLIWFYFQTSTARAGYASQQRAYGDGLKKLEPGDWSKLRVPDWRLWDAASIARATALASTALAACATGADDCPASDLAELERLIEVNRVATAGSAAWSERQLVLV